MAARLKERYQTEIVPALREKFGYKNIMQVPILEKIVINMGVGDATQDARMLDAAVEELTRVAGQRPAIRLAKKSVAGFKVREGNKIACMVTLRGERMYEFLDRLINVAIPRIRDFRGISPKSFDQHGNFTIGIRDQSIFPEVDQNNIIRTRGMNVTLVIDRTHETESSRELLRQFGMPFRN
mgnify:CR=1 FL=1